MELYSREEYLKYADEYLKDKWETYCPFCDKKAQKQYILWEWKYWQILHNKFPYNGNSLHLLAIPLKCERHTRNLSSEEWGEFGEVEKFMKKFYGDTNYFSFIREDGKVKSIHHLHYHFLPGEVLPQDIENMLTKQWI